MAKYGIDYSFKVKMLNSRTRKYVKGFHCGNVAIDYYFRNQAAADLTSVTYMFIDADTDLLMTCATIACSAIFTDGDDQPQPSTLLSAMEIKYLATDEHYQHIPYTNRSRTPSLSDVILDYMMTTMYKMSHSKIGASKIVLYSVPRAVAFYSRHGFKSFGDKMYGDKGDFLDGCQPMYFDMN